MTRVFHRNLRYTPPTAIAAAGVYVTDQTGAKYLGQRGDHVLIAPPFIIQEAELDLLVERLVETVNAATDSV